MNIEITKDFEKKLKKIKNPALNKQTVSIIKNIIAAESITDIRNLKKLTGHTHYFRIRTGNYRIGVYIDETSTVWLAAIAHRKDIYTYFP